MHTFKYDDQGDWVLNELVHGDEQIVQNLKHLFRQRVSEWLFDERQGFRHEETWKKVVDKRVITQAVYDCAYQEPRVKEVKDVQIDFKKIQRRLSIKFTAIKENGEGIEVNFDVDSTGLQTNANS